MPSNKPMMSDAKAKRIAAAYARAKEPNAAEVGRKFGCSKYTILRILRRLGVEIKTPRRKPVEIDGLSEDEQEICRDVGRFLGDLRRAAGLTQHELAEKMGVALWTVFNRERGARDFRLSVIHRQLLAMGCRMRTPGEVRANLSTLLQVFYTEPQKAPQTKEEKPASRNGARERLTAADVVFCNCYRCKRKLLGQSMTGRKIPAKFAKMEICVRRIDGRPICAKCRP